MCSGFHTVGAQNKIKWHSWEEAIEKSKKDKKKIFVDVYTDWCGWCKKMDKSTFADESIIRYINANYYPVKFNAEMESSVTLKGTEYKFISNGLRGYHELAAQLLSGKMSYPSMVFLDEEFNMIQAIPGFQNTDTFGMIISYFGSNNHKVMPWNKFSQNYQKSTYFLSGSEKKE